MQRVDSYRVDGAEVKRAGNGCLIVGFSSQRITDTKLVTLRTITEDYFLAFYNCEFSEKSINFMVSCGVKSVGIFHSSFGDCELKELSHSELLESIKLHDTKVTAECVSEVRQLNHKLKIAT